jgi:hypothetical protein
LENVEERLRRGWEDIILGFKEEEFQRVDWAHLSQHRDQWQALVNTFMNNPVP